MIDHGRHNILGVKINAVDYEQTVQRIVDAAKAGQRLSVSALAVHGLMTGALNREHRFRLNHLDLLVPDGQPVRWALRGLHGVRLAERVYGPRLMLKTCQRAEEEDLPVFLFGGSGELLAQLQQSLQQKFPKLPIAGLLPSKFRRLTGPQEKQELVETITGSGAKITFVGLGCPRQEVFAYEFQDALSMPLLAVGAAFNFHAGSLAQAPAVMQRWGLEWLFRLCAEPRRLWKRYLLLNPLYLTLLAAQWTGLKRFDDAAGSPPGSEVLYG